MSERTSHTLLGAFVLGGLLLGVIALMLTANNTFKNSNSQHVVMVFDGSVTGLTKGAPVAIRGATIGEVLDIRVRFEESDNLNLLMEVEAVINEAAVTRESGGDRKIGQELIDAGLRAQLNNLSLVTGLLYVQLDFFPETEVKLRAPDSKTFEIPTIPSPFEKLTKNFEQLNLPVLVSDLQAIAKAMRKLTESDAIAALPGNANRALTSTQQLAEEMQGLVTRMEPKVVQTLASTKAAAETAERELPIIAEQINLSLAQLNTTLVSLQRSSDTVSTLLDPDSPTLYNLNETLTEIARASRSLNILARSLEEQPQSLLLGRPEEIAQ